MCCVCASLVFLGPRIANIIWWLIDPLRFAETFPSILWPILGIIFLPFTTLAYVLFFPGGITPLEWIVIIVAILVDLGAYGGGVFSRNNR